MAAVAGPSPWNQSDYLKFRGGYKRMSRGHADRIGSEFFMSFDPETGEALSSGWRAKQTEGWEQQPTQSKTRRLKLYNGRYVNVPDNDYQDFIGHRKTEDPDEATIEYISKAFDGEHQFDRWDTKVGHIEYMWYSPTYQLLLVGFASDGAEVVYFRVPKEVYSELLHHAKTGGTYQDKHNVERHILGKVFWNIIRIRGNYHGSRYKFQYQQEGERKTEVIDNTDAIGVLQQQFATGEKIEKKKKRAVTEADLSTAEINAEARRIRIKTLMPMEKAMKQAVLNLLEIKNAKEQVE